VTRFFISDFQKGGFIGELVSRTTKIITLSELFSFVGVIK
jgi:hypothetical protein